MASSRDCEENPFVNIRKELSEDAHHVRKGQGYKYELKLTEAKNKLINDIKSKIAELPPLHMANPGSIVIDSKAFAWFCDESEPLVPEEGALIAVGTNTHYAPNIHFWDSSTGEGYWAKGGHEDGGVTVIFSPTGTTLASSGDDKTIKIWNVKTGECLRTMEGHEDFVRAVAFSPDGTNLASGSGDKTIKLWNANTGECLRTIKGHVGDVKSVAFSRNGAILASGSRDRTIKLWNVNTGECLRTIEGHEGSVRAVCFSPDGAVLASGSSDRTIKLWNSNTGECLRTMEGHSPKWIPGKEIFGRMTQGRETQAWVNSVSFSPEGTILASGSEDHTIKLWNVNTGECTKTLEGHKSSVHAVCFSPDGAVLVSGSYDQRIRLWNVHTGKCLRTVNVKSVVMSVAFSPDDKTFSRLDLEGIFREIKGMLGEAEFRLSTDDGVKFNLFWD